MGDVQETGQLIPYGLDTTNAILHLAMLTIILKNGSVADWVILSNLFRNSGSREKTMPTYQYWNEDDVGTYVQNNYKFMDELFGRHGDNLRNSLVNAADEDALRDKMNAKLPHL
jgi:hypothetical protein